MRRTAFLLLPVLLISALAAQPPVPGTAAIPPTPPVLPTTPAAATAASAGEVTLAQFDPLNSFPATTQSAVRSAVLGSNWLARMSQSNGRFQYGHRPALRQAMDGDNDLAQAKAALAMAQAARFTGNERQAAIAGQAILSLLALTKFDPADPSVRVPVAPSQTCNRVGFSAVLALAIFELPGADARLAAEGERLVEFIHRNLKTDGSVHYIDSLTETATKTDPAGMNEYPGLALQAVAASQRVKPAAWKAEAMKKAVEHYRAAFKAQPHPMLAATLSPAFAEWYLQSKSNEAAAAVFEMNDHLAGVQYPAGDPRHPLWAGGFRPAPNVEGEPGFDCGWHLQSLAAGYRVLRLNPDLARAERYHQVIADAVGFATGLQYAESNTRHFDNNYRAGSLIGGFHLSPTDGNLRLDATAASVIGLLKCLNSGADRN
jgi:hypothetical protein